MINTIKVSLSDPVKIEDTVGGLKITAPKDYVIKHIDNQLSIDAPENTYGNNMIRNISFGNNAVVICNHVSYTSNCPKEKVEPIEHIITSSYDVKVLSVSDSDTLSMCIQLNPYASISFTGGKLKLLPQSFTSIVLSLTGDNPFK